MWPLESVYSLNYGNIIALIHACDSYNIVVAYRHYNATLMC